MTSTHLRLSYLSMIHSNVNHCLVMLGNVGQDLEIAIYAPIYFIKLGSAQVRESKFIFKLLIM